MKNFFMCRKFRYFKPRGLATDPAISILKVFSVYLIISFLLPNVTFGQGTGSTVVGFEVDASFKSGQIPSFWKTTAPNQTYFGGVGDDWSKGPTGNAVLKQSGGVSVPGLTTDRTALWQVDGNWGTNVPPDNSVFGGTSNKNGDLIGAGQSPYLLDVGSGGPQKNDITNVFLHTRRNSANNNLWLFVGAETRSINGSSYLDFEYNQAGVTTLVDADGKRRMIGQGAVGGRTVDDILLVINYTQGGKTPIVGIRKWLANSTWSAELVLPAGAAFMTTNTLDVDAVAPLASYTGDGTPSNTSIAFQVVEGALNISSLGLAGLEACSPNATVTVKTRSSASYTSELKDWDILHFPLTPTSLSSVADITPQCRALNGTNVFSVSGTYTDGTPTWSATGGTISNPSYVNGVATATLTVTAPTSSAMAILTVASPNQNCSSAVASKQALINPNPTVDADASPAGSVNLNSAPPHYTLSTTVDGTLSNTGFNYSWVQNPPEQPAGNTNGSGFLSGTNIPDPTFTANPLGAGAYTWTVTATNKVTGCFSSDPVTRTLTSGFTCPGVTTADVCAGTTSTYTANADIGEFETWQWTVNNGAKINGADNGKSVSVTAGSASFTLTLTVTFDNPAVAKSECPYNVTVKPNPVGSASPQTICSGATTSIGLNSSLASTTFTWTAAIHTTPTGGTITGYSACSSSCGASIAQTLTNTGTSAGVIRYTVTPTTNGCTGAPFTVDATVNPVPVVNQPGNQVKCNGTSTTAITFSGAASTSFTWTNNTTSIGLGASGTGNINAFTATNTGSVPVTATIEVTPHFTGGGITCDGTAKTFTITVNPTPVVNQPGNQEVCNGTNTTAVTFSGAGATSFTWTNNTTSIGLGASGTGNINAFTATNSGSTTVTATITVTPHFTGGGITCDGVAKTFTIKVNPDAAPPQATYIPPTCTEDKFKVQITNPQVGSTYELTQQDGYKVTLPSTPGGYVSGDLIFTGLHIGQGYSIVSTTSAGCKSNPKICPEPANLIAGRSTQVSVTDDVRIQLVADAPTVSATPNPFVDKIRFSISTEVSGNGSLDLYNLMGQKVQTVYQGYFDSNTLRTFEYKVPLSQRANLIYVLKVGNKKTSVKLIGIK
jgi:hypothetical protein